MNDEFRMEQRTVNQAGESLGRYTAKTFGWMFAGLLITLIVAISMYVTGAFIYVIRIPAWNFLLLAAELIVCQTGKDVCNCSEKYVFPVLCCKWYRIQPVFFDV